MVLLTLKPQVSGGKFNLPSMRLPCILPPQGLLPSTWQAVASCTLQMQEHQGWAAMQGLRGSQ